MMMSSLARALKLSILNIPAWAVEDLITACTRIPCPKFWDFLDSLVFYNPITSNISRSSSVVN